MESLRAGRKPCSLCRWDRSGSSLFPPILPTARVGQLLTLAPTPLSFLRWSCFLSKVRTRPRIRTSDWGRGESSNLDLSNSSKKDASLKNRYIAVIAVAVVLFLNMAAEPSASAPVRDKGLQNGWHRSGKLSSHRQPLQPLVLTCE